MNNVACVFKNEITYELDLENINEPIIIDYSELAGECIRDKDETLCMHLIMESRKFIMNEWDLFSWTHCNDIYIMVSKNTIKRFETPLFFKANANKDSEYKGNFSCSMIKDKTWHVITTDDLKDGEICLAAVYNCRVRHQQLYKLKNWVL